MRTLLRIRLKIRSLFRRGRVEEELSDELQFHVDRLTEQHAARGMKHEDARAKALRDVGNVGVWKEACRDQRGFNPLDSLWRDIRFALRIAARDRIFSSVVVLSLSLGVAGTSAIFSLVYAVLIDPFPYRDAPGISLLTFSAPGIRGSTLLFPAADYARVAEAGTLRESFAFAESVAEVGLSPGAFSFLSVPMLHGRTFGSPDNGSRDTPARVTVLSYRFWQRRYGGSDAIGQTLELDHESFTVIGIAPPRFNWASGDVYVPLRPRPGGGPEVNIAVRAREGRNLSAVVPKSTQLRSALAGPVRDSILAATSASRP